MMKSILGTIMEAKYYTTWIIVPVEEPITIILLNGHKMNVAPNDSLSSHRLMHHLPALIFKAYS